MRRGIPTRVVTLGFGEQDGRDDFPDIQFKALRSKEELSDLDDTLVFVTYAIAVPTKRQSYAILHCPMQRLDPPFDLKGAEGKQLIAPSRFAAKLWGETLRIRPSRIPTVYPFAENCYKTVQRPQRQNDKLKILFAGRLTPDKGIYTLLASLHMDSMKSLDYEITVTKAASDSVDGKMVLPLLEVHPSITVVEPRRSPQGVAQLMAEHDVVIMPSTNLFWQEIFGIVSVEAQHAGCRVVASNAGGLPETDCGGMVLIKPDDPQALANGILKASLLGPLTEAERLYASTHFTVQRSVDNLLRVMASTEKKQHMPLLQKQGALVREQFDFAFSTVNQLGLRLSGDNQFR
jgi:glycosyltransferase involved in cell wall biosynthesis